MPIACEKADALVAGNERRCRLDRPIAVGRMDVGMANAARGDADQDLAGTNLGNGDFADFERCAERVDDSGHHGAGHGGDPQR